MSQKKKSQLLKEKEQLEQSKLELESMKAEGQEWTPAMQVKLDEVIGELADVEEELQVVNEEPATYKPAKGTEGLIHLSIVKGRRFNPNTGKEETQPFVQTFTFSEWQLFKKNFTGLGYVIVAVLHDPYNEAAEYVAN